MGPRAKKNNLLSYTNIVNMIAILERFGIK